MVNWKSKYLEIKLKYINAKNQLVSGGGETGNITQMAAPAQRNLTPLERRVLKQQAAQQQTEATEETPAPPLFSDHSIPLPGLDNCTNCGEPDCGTSCKHPGVVPPAPAPAPAPARKIRVGDYVVARVLIRDPRTGYGRGLVDGPSTFSWQTIRAQVIDKRNHSSRPGFEYRVVETQDRESHWIYHENILSIERRNRR